MNRKVILQQLLHEKLVIIIRLKQVDDADAIVKALVEGGVKAIEITSNTPDYTRKITEIRLKYPELTVGAGTITSVKLALEAINAGAQFLVTPHTCPQIAVISHEREVPVIMGAMTPTDIVLASNAKADIIKLFPSGELGPEYLASLARGPFLNTPFFPVGGVTPDNIRQWMNAGACGVGVGGALAAPVNTPAEVEALTQRAAAIINDLKDYPTFEVTQ
ncbi:bifunctional 4-hydroxy-2-oxoglutarate aldolase/2-dehydro-3-deoxy-phosphogluconate aldolase [Gilvimarinus chinensis]|uniref:bifunctional 4-hydroxy-2-oxoglutarate aldolase/2-dehydro-3-deoxy-phosphogluconate aldolase n=1 Tax=Gilvimarinus chinensis TaxID=396005 RepID=UPI000375F2A8|nr:bifunctional 4-hydroxy-2-oxoglutarate aldolase/2-dehydro-3-deoxy-phosphogluconate aldolase [Gilvimarinus chinensis]